MTTKEHQGRDPRKPQGKDVRAVRGKAAPETVQSLKDLRPIWFETQLALARGFYRMHRNGAFLFERSASIAHFASLQGFDGKNAWRLLDLGYALERLPGLEEALRERRVVFPSACALGSIFRDPGLYVRGDDTWLEWAAFKTLADLERRIRTRIAEAHGQPPANTTIHAKVTAETKELLREAQKLASAKARRLLKMGETLHVVARSYVLEMDPTTRLPRARRLPDTAERPWSRQVPAEVVRAILERSAGLCEFGCCERPGAELCHLHPHARGSAREKEDLVLGCHSHHTLLDNDLIHFVAWTQEGLPLFRGTRDDAFLVPKPLPEERGRVEVPDWMVPALTPVAGRIMRRLLEQPAEDEAAAKTPSGGQNGAMGERDGALGGRNGALGRRDEAVGRPADPGRQPAPRRDRDARKKAPEKDAVDAGDGESGPSEADARPPVPP